MRQLGILFIATIFGLATSADSRHIVLQSTTSTQNSGLYDSILPRFTAQTGIEVRVVAVGSGQALRQASDCNGEVVIVHDPEAELHFLDAGFASQRFELMRNDYVIVGPANDPAQVQMSHSVPDAFQRIAENEYVFVSRGDNSGTHNREIELWAKANFTPQSDWYRETGSGMGATLNIAVGMDAYALTDKATWIRFGNKRDHSILFEGGDDLLNIYSIMPVNSLQCRFINAEDAKIFVDWMISEQGQEAINSFTEDGIQLFESIHNKN